MLAIASNAVRLMSGRRHNSTSRTSTRRIIVSGALVDLFTRCSTCENGKALSRAIANPIREVTVMLLKPAQNKFTRSMMVIVTEPILL